MLESLSDQREVRNYVGGTWRTPSNDKGQDVINPAMREQLAYVSFSDRKDVDEAVTAARDAFESWRSRSVEERIQPRFRLKQLVKDHQ